MKSVSVMVPSVGAPASCKLVMVSSSAVGSARQSGNNTVLRLLSVLVPCFDAPSSCKVLMVSESASGSARQSGNNTES